MSEYKYEVDMQSARVFSERKGRAEGLAEGMEEAARNTLAEGASIEFVREPLIK